MFGRGTLAGFLDGVADYGVLVQHEQPLVGGEYDLAVVSPMIIEDRAVVAVTHLRLEHNLVNLLGTRLMDGTYRCEELFARNRFAVGLERDGDCQADYFVGLEGVQGETNARRVGRVFAQGFHLGRLKVF